MHTEDRHDRITREHALQQVFSGFVRGVDRTLAWMRGTEDGLRAEMAAIENPRFEAPEVFRARCEAFGLAITAFAGRLEMLENLAIAHDRLARRVHSQAEQESTFVALDNGAARHAQLEGWIATGRVLLPAMRLALAHARARELSLVAA